MPTLRPSTELPGRPGSSGTPGPLGSRLYNLRKARKLARERFLAGRKAEAQYARALKKIADQVDAIVRGMAPGGDVTTLVQTLNRYADMLTPWSEATASRMIQDVAKRDRSAWIAHSKEIGAALRREIDEAPIGQAFRENLALQVREITSIPRKAATRLFEITQNAMVSGKRAEDIADELLETGRVSRGQAKMLARTGVSSTATAMTKARAEYIGSEGYWWATSKDGAVRPSHRKMEGKFVRWDSPPTLDNYTAHAGCYANCRCFCVVHTPDRFGM